MTTRDVLLATGCGALTIATLLAAPALDDGGMTVPTVGSGAWWAVLAVFVVQAVLLLGVRRAPRSVLLLTAVAVVTAALAGAGDLTGVGLVAVIAATYAVASTRAWSRAWPTVVTAAILVALASGIGAGSAGAGLAAAVTGSLAQAVGTLGLTILVAFVVTTRREATQARAAQLDAATREQHALVQAAIARERTAMARELHDIAAHHLSGIAVMTAAIGAQIDTDPAAAKTAVRQVREQSTAVLRDLRSLVGLLREGTEEHPGSDPRPETIAGIAALVADATSAGRLVELTVLSDRESLGEGVGPLAQLAGYRAAQEALANAARHAPGARCEVTVDDRAADAVVVTVRNDAPGTSPSAGSAGSGGYGLIGMRERAELTGSSLEVGPTDDGGWRVVVRLPREEPT